MKKNHSLSVKTRMAFIAIILFFGLFTNLATAQTALTTLDTFVWNGAKSSSWTDPDNWTILRGTTVPGTNTYPGEIGTLDVVIINKSDTPFPAILGDEQPIDIARLNVTNAFGGEAGATFTLNAGAELNVGNNTAQSNHVLLNGGNIINNGTLNITAISVGSSGFPVIGINCLNPIVLPSVPTEYGYSGSGILRINLASANFAGATAIAVLGNNNPVAAPGVTLPPTTANATYKFVLNNPEITFNQATVLGITAIRAGGGNNANKLIVTGTGFTIGTLGTPSIGGLLSLGGGSSVTIEAGTTLTLNSAATNANGAISGFSANAFAANFTNKGTINIKGNSLRGGMGFSTGSKDIACVYNINNEGTLDIDLNSAFGGQGAFVIGNGGGGTANVGSAINIFNTGTMNFKNRATAAGHGFPIFTTTAGEAPRVFFTNSGTMNLEGSTYCFGLKTTVNNTGVLNSNTELRSFSAVNNNLGGRINFVRTAATATTRQVNFTIVTEANVTGGVGSIYRDSNNNDLSIVAQKFGGGFSVLANVLSTATVAPSGTLTRVTGTGTESIAYTAASLAPLNSAMGTTNNAGVINTGANATNLGVIGALATTASTSVLSPGGDTNNGLMILGEIPSDALVLMGTLKMQASGSTTTGVDYDAVKSTGQLDYITISSAILDVTGLYKPTVATTIDIITTYIDPAPLDEASDKSGAIIGQFAEVIGLPKGWMVNYTEGFGNKVQLVYDPNLSTSQFAKSQFSYYPNPTKNQLNVNAAKNISKIELFNLLGQKVQSTNVNAVQKQLDMSNLQNGIYVMEVTIDNAKESFKIVKQ